MAGYGVFIHKLLHIAERVKMCLDGVTLLVRSKVDAHLKAGMTDSANASTLNVKDDFSEKARTRQVSSGSKNEHQVGFRVSAWLAFVVVWLCKSSGFRCK